MACCSVTPFRNRDNFAKHLLLHYETGSNVLLIVFSWLYNGPLPYESSLAQFLIGKTKYFNNNEKLTLQKLYKQEVSLHQLDFSLLYSIIKASCDVAAHSDNVWGKNCPSERSEDLEHLLYKLKQGRNDLAHPSEEQKNLTDSDVERKAIEIQELLSQILTKTGEKAKVPPEEVNGAIQSVLQNIEKICKSEDHDSEIKPYIHQLIKDDLKASYESDLQNYLENELPIYAKPSLILHKEDGSEEQPVQDILKNFQNHKNVLQIRGGAGEGKTSLANYLFYTWLTGKEEVDNLTGFHIVFLLQCQYINTRSVSEFLESELPTTILSLSNTSSLRRQLKSFNILWILDGFDQSTAEANGFLKEILEILSETQKLLITLRPNYVEHVDLLIPVHHSTVASMGLLNDENIKEIITSLSKDETRAKALMKIYKVTMQMAPERFRNPLTVKLCIIQLQRTSDFTKINSLTQLYKADINHKLKSLAKRLEPKTSLTHLELEEKIQNWFDYLCYQSFHLICCGIYGSVNKSVEITLRQHANLNYLIASDCLSTFFPSEINKSNEFCYLHLTQQYYLSAIYISKALAMESIYQNHLSAERDLAYSDYESRARFLVHYRELILWLIWTEVEESPALNVDLIMKAVAFSECEWSIRFVAYFIEASSYNEEFIGSVAKKISETCWYVLDDEVTLKAASKLIKITHPESIYFVFRKIDTNKFQLLLYELLHCLLDRSSNTQVMIVFSEYEKIGANEVCDFFLPKIQKKASKIKMMKITNYLNINTFTGAVRDCSFLLDCCNNLTVLQLRLTTEKSFSQFLQLLNLAKKMQVIRATLDFQINEIAANNNFISYFPKRYRPISKLIFPHINDQNYNDYLSLVKTLCSDDYYMHVKLANHKFQVVSIPEKNLHLESQKIIKNMLSKWVFQVNIVASLVDEYGNIKNSQWAKIVTFCDPGFAIPKRT